MPRSSFGLTSLWGSLAMLSLCGTASAQWFSGSSNSCGCSSAPSLMGSAPIFRQSSAFSAASMSPASYAYGDSVQCGQPMNCQIEQPVQVMQIQAVAPVVQQQVVAMQQMQQVVQPVMQDVAVTEYQPVKRTVSKPVVTTEYVDQAVTVMTPVVEQRIQNVNTVDYQTVTEYKTVRKQVGGGWVTKNVPVNRISAAQYDSRQNMMGAMNRASYNMRAAMTPQYRQVREYVQPQTMTCTVPCTRRVAVPSTKQVTYNYTRMQPTQTTRKVAVNKTSYQTAEVTVMAPVQVMKTMQVGTRMSYVPAGTVGASAIGSNPTNPGMSSLPTPIDQNTAKPRSAQATDSKSGLDAGKLNSSSLETYDQYGRRLSDATEEPPKVFTASSKSTSAPSVVRVSQWVARASTSTKPSSVPQPSGKSAAIAIADSAK